MNLGQRSLTLDVFRGGRKGTIGKSAGELLGEKQPWNDGNRQRTLDRKRNKRTRAEGKKVNARGALGRGLRYAILGEESEKTTR